MLIFALALDPQLLWVIIQVAFGLGAVIFVHELGHFLVAKWCGVKCEKFYLGFDIGGISIWKKKWGETVYGIGILPLGGYVKMLGQEDNPGQQTAELERARLAGGATDRSESSDNNDAIVTEGGTPQFDPRSYVAKSVPQRMAIISAGVIMNVIFALVVSMIAYAVGVRYVPPIVTGTMAGDPAWVAGIEPGDEIVQIGDLKNPRFRDLLSQVTLADAGQPINLEILRPDGKEFSLTITPGETARMQKIGIVGPGTLTLLDDERATIEGSAAREAGLKPRDRIEAVNGEPVTDFVALKQVFVEKAAEAVTLSIARPSENEVDEDGEPVYTNLDVELPPQPIYRLGLVMTMGPITAVQKGSPADAAGIKAGDKLLEIDGESVGDPLTLGHRLGARSGDTVRVKLQRGGDTDPLEVDVTLRGEQITTMALAPGKPWEASPLGIAYGIENRVAAVNAGSPADGKIEPGAVITQVGFRKLTGEGAQADFEPGQAVPLSDESQAWPFVFTNLQSTTSRYEIELTLAEGEPVRLRPTASDDWFNADRGINTESPMRWRQAHSFGQAVALGWHETTDAISQPYYVIKKMVRQELPVDSIGGPLSIAAVAGQSAYKGMDQLVMFLVLLSANLAVINFLPIPLLDGGHMVFLIIEGIRGKPVSERIALAVNYAGLCLLLSLIALVMYLDISKLS
ncbi:MAG: site-2 protease family protein [Pirellulales bacterium]